MKIRNGFVSNSSSSSYIVAIRQTNVPCPHCGRKDPNFLDMIENARLVSDDNSVNLRGRKNIEDYVKNGDWGYDDNPKREEVLNKLGDYKSKGDEWLIADISISYHDQSLKDIMQNLIESGNMRVIYNSED